MFDWLDMLKNYEERVVANTEKDGWVLDTCEVTDRPWTFETAFRHPDYHNGMWIIIATAEGRDRAKVVHDTLVDFFSRNGLPRTLTDVYDGGVYERS